MEYSEFPHPEYRSGNDMFNGRFPSQKNCRRCLKVTWHVEYQPQRHVSGPAFSLELIAAGDPEDLDIVVRKIEVEWQWQCGDVMT